jgi:hypothetical protein
MAVPAELKYFDGLIFLDLLPGSRRARVSNDPDDRNWPFYFYYDDEKLACGERELVGLEVLDVSNITDYWLSELDKMEGLPRVDVPDLGLMDVTFADVLRWARQIYPSRYSKATV